MKNLFVFLLALTALLFVAAPDPVFAQDPQVTEVAADGATTDAPIVTDPLPGVSLEMALALVTFLSPFVTWLFKLLAGLAGKYIPKFLLPVIAGGIGLLLTWLTDAQTSADLAWYIYGLIMLAGVGLREFNDRLIVKPAQALRTRSTTTDTGEIG
jgi:hypothetical protein